MSSLLLSCLNLTKSFGSKLLFEELSFNVSVGDKMGLVGPNGSGKSTLLKVLAEQENVREGEIARKKGLKVSYVPQTSDLPSVSILEVLLEAQSNEVEATIALSKMGFTNFEQKASELSGGWQKKLEIARALVVKPDLIILDEPTNHLDLSSIEWLEGFLRTEVRSYIVTSHDRRFLENTTNRMMELNRVYPKGLFIVEGNWDTFLEQKEGFLKAQLEYQRGLKSKVKREEEWLRTTPQARTTKSRSRTNQAEGLISELEEVQRRTHVKKLSIDFTSTERETRKLISAKNIAKTRGDKLLFSKLDLLLSPGTRLGIAGPNGCGKSTLLKILAGEIDPDQGTLKCIDGLKIVYFDQMREQLPLNLTIKDAFSPTGDMVHFQGKSIHVNSWAKRFFFSPDKMTLPLSQLSGGERARLLIAKLMLQPADILLLDEPTNDLDIDTLEVIEDSLNQFPGAICLISHDRYFLSRVCNQILALDLNENDRFLADYHQYEAKKTSQSQKAPEKEKKAPAKGSPPLKVSYKDKYEFEQLESKIRSLEQEIATLHKTLENAPPDQLQTLSLSLHNKEEELEKAFFRWNELDDKMK